MIAVGAECRTCHRVKEVSPTGTVLWRGSTEMCLMCHDSATVQQFTTYHKKLRAAVPELEVAIERADGALKSAKLPEVRLAAATKELASLQHDLDFLRTANDVHNMHYAAKLIQALSDRLSALCRELKVAEPKVALPPPMKQVNRAGTAGPAAP
jgi:predicted CXXCH cytochrome family protein